MNTLSGFGKGRETVKEKFASFVMVMVCIIILAVVLFLVSLIVPDRGCVNDFTPDERGRATNVCG